MPWLPGLSRVVSSNERKAIETVEAMIAQVSVSMWFDEKLGENDRSAMGFLPPAEF